ncbi:ribbon-helix-helix protein, CopG family [Neotamlana sedimentorum]|nr:ribbon-helix-helix protein, CopG family [Tamlana sedimentorum]
MTRAITEKKTITLRSEIVERLERIAQEENRNFSNMMETVAINYLKQNDNYAL